MEGISLVKLKEQLEPNSVAEYSQLAVDNYNMDNLVPAYLNKFNLNLIIGQIAIIIKEHRIKVNERMFKRLYSKGKDEMAKESFRSLDICQQSKQSSKMRLNKSMIQMRK